MKKLIWTSSVVSSLVFFTSNCHQPSEAEPQTEAIYQSIKAEMQQNLEACKVDTGGLYIVNGNRVVPDSSDVKEAITHYDELVAALSSTGISLEFTPHLDLPVPCHWSKLAMNFNFGSSAILRTLWLHLTNKGSLVSPFGERPRKVDVIRISISSQSSADLFKLNEKNIEDPTAYTVETDLNTGAKKRIFTIFVNAGSRWQLAGSQIYDMVFDYSQKI